MSNNLIIASVGTAPGRIFPTFIYGKIVFMTNPIGEVVFMAS